MTNKRKFVRFIIEGEVEVTDPIQVKTFNFDSSIGTQGELGFLEMGEEFEEVFPPEFRAIQRVVAEALSARSEETGLKPVLLSGRARNVVDGQHVEIVYPETGARDEFGNYSDTV